MKIENGLTFVDLFCGIGGFRIAAESFGWRCEFSCDIDDEVRRAYFANFGEVPAGDIRLFKADDIPDHDVLMAGFPCQPFSIIGAMNGTADARGTLFFEIARIMDAKRPRWFILENVKQLVGNNKGRTINEIMETIRSLGYTADWTVLNALDFGLPQKRERVFIVGNNAGKVLFWPKKSSPVITLSEILEEKVDRRYYASPAIRTKRLASHHASYSPSIWHENKAGHISSYPFSCALRANASHNYLLVDGIRRLTPREMLRLQGFHEWFQIVCNDSHTKKQAGNAVPVPVVKAIIQQIMFAESEESFDAAKIAAARPHQAALSFEPVS